MEIIIGYGLSKRQDTPSANECINLRFRIIPIIQLPSIQLRLGVVQAIKLASIEFCFRVILIV